MLAQCHGGNFLVEVYSSCSSADDPPFEASPSTPAGLLHATYCSTERVFLALIYTWSP